MIHYNHEFIIIYRRVGPIILKYPSNLWPVPAHSVAAWQNQPEVL